MAKKAVKKSSQKKKNTKFSIRFKFAIALGVVALSLFGIAHLFGYTRAECANSNTCIKDLDGQFEENKLTAEYEGRILAVPQFVDDTIAYQRVLGENTSNKRIEVDLTNQKLYTFEGDTKIHEFPVSTGKRVWGGTPTGNFSIWIKLRYTKMSGGSKDRGDYYYLPNVPYTMYFYNDAVPKYRGYGIHGAYWHNNFGHPMSHGCVNMREEDVAQVFYWASPYSEKGTVKATSDNPGTPIVIYGETPES